MLLSIYKADFISRGNNLTIQMWDTQMPIQELITLATEHSEREILM